MTDKSKKALKRVTRDAIGVTAIAGAGVATWVIAQKVAASKGVSLAILPSQVTPENEAISNIVGGVVGTLTGMSAGVWLSNQHYQDKTVDMFVEQLEKDEVALKKLMSAINDATYDAPANNPS